MRKILIFTGTRADYGILYPLIKVFKNDSNYKIEILATGSHLSEQHGLTYKEIEADGFKVDWPVDIDIKNSGGTEETLNSFSVAVSKFGKVVSESKADMAFVLGDRYEALAFAVVCQLHKMPLAHLHGGELTLGAVDDAFRHAITKLSYFHFAASSEYAERITQLGEPSGNVFNVGALGVENSLSTPLKNMSELTETLKIQDKKVKLMVTFHPATLESEPKLGQIENLLAALKKTIKYYHDDVFCIFTMPNADPGNMVIYEKINHFINENTKNCIGFKSMGRVNYLSALKLADAVVGNSSSGIIEAPAFRVPTVNIGSRQEGRLKASSVIDCDCSVEAVFSAVVKVVDLKKNNKFSKVESLYGNGQTSLLIKKIIDQIKIPTDLRKRFYDKKD